MDVIGEIDSMKRSNFFVGVAAALNSTDRIRRSNSALSGGAAAHANTGGKKI